MKRKLISIKPRTNVWYWNYIASRTAWKETREVVHSTWQVLLVRGRDHLPHLPFILALASFRFSLQSCYTIISGFGSVERVESQLELEKFKSLHCHHGGTYVGPSGQWCTCMSLSKIKNKTRVDNVLTSTSLYFKSPGTRVESPQKKLHLNATWPLLKDR